MCFVTALFAQGRCRDAHCGPSSARALAMCGLSVVSVPLPFRPAGRYSSEQPHLGCDVMGLFTCGEDGELARLAFPPPQGRTDFLNRLYMCSDWNPAP
ncbi:hypothetical protein AAFF_G00039120 [Aldrovandia affinis]|uniref:Uncharacterized protein n=1 Tax=Aldrovandia affinis TaxID=143900 RepID=A0AAD7T5D8_9TELE|nr:hypothetical protein AAFF_G00039120 [Aldrovandia affinis]